MSQTNWIDVIPSVMSAIATVAAAVAAFGSLRVSREATDVSKLSVLAIHHGAAAKTLAENIEILQDKLVPLSEIAYHTWVDWARNIEAYDNRGAGGTNPRPLRHVLSNASEMLANHGSEKGAKYRRAQHMMFCIVRNGINNTSDNEYARLLQRVDGSYSDFEGVFGEPAKNRCAADSLAFRWAYYQLIRRVSSEQWQNIWNESWQADGWLSKYHDEHARVKSVLESVGKSLKSEKVSLAHSALPLEANPSLSKKYDTLLEIVDVLLNDCGLDVLSIYREHPHKDDTVPLIIYSMGVSFLTTDIIENALYKLKGEG